MATKTQEQFLNDVKGQIRQFVYRGTEMPSNDLFRFIQEASGNGSLNWHTTANKEALAALFTELATSVNSYTLSDGDFRTYLVMKLSSLIASTYEDQLFRQFLLQGYNVSPESVEGSVSEAYSTEPVTNTNFPGTSNAANKFIPVPPATRLIPGSLYSSD